MLLVILGAGASYDSIRVLTDVSNVNAQRMPLANDLFNLRTTFTQALNRHSHAAPLVNRLSKLTESEDFNVEEELQRIAARGLKGHSEKQFLALRFYLADIIRQTEQEWVNVTAQVRLNHVSLFDEIKLMNVHAEGAVPIVTFNYDTMVERALSVCRENIGDIDGMVRHVRWRLFKLHGSVNWIRIAENLGRQNPAEICDYAPKLRLSAEVYEDAKFISNDVSRIPAIAVPLAVKQEFECPRSHVEALKQMLKTVDQILIVGWKAGEETFLKLLAEQLTGPVSVVCVDRQPELGLPALHRLHNAGVRVSKFGLYGGGFSRFIDRNLAQVFSDAKPFDPSMTARDV